MCHRCNLKAFREDQARVDSSGNENFLVPRTFYSLNVKCKLLPVEVWTAFLDEVTTAVACTHLMS